MPTTGAVDVLGAVYTGEQHVTITTTASRLALPADTGSALLSVVTGPVRVGFDPATLVTATTGISLPAGTLMQEASPGRLSLVTASGTATLDVVFFD